MSMKPWRVEGCGAFPERSGPVGGCWPETMSMPEVWVCSGQWPSGAVVPPEAQGLKERIMPGFPGEPLAKVTWQSWMIPRENGSILDALFQVRGSKHGPRKFYPLLLPSPGLTLEVSTAVTCRLSGEPAEYRTNEVRQTSAPLGRFTDLKCCPVGDGRSSRWSKLGILIITSN